MIWITGAGSQHATRGSEHAVLKAFWVHRLVGSTTNLCARAVPTNVWLRTIFDEDIWRQHVAPVSTKPETLAPAEPDTLPFICCRVQQRHCGGTSTSHAVPVPSWSTSYQLPQCLTLLLRQPWSLAHQQCPILLAPSVPYVTLAPVDVYIEPVPAVIAAPTPVVVYISLAPGGYAAPASVVENIDPSPDVWSVAPAPVDEYMAPTPSLYTVPAPVVEYIALGTAPAPVVVDIAPAHAVSYAAPAPVGDYMALAPAIAARKGYTSFRASAAASMHWVSGRLVRLLHARRMAPPTLGCNQIQAKLMHRERSGNAELCHCVLNETTQVSLA